MDGVGEAVAATLLGVSLLLLRPCCYEVLLTPWWSSEVSSTRSTCRRLSAQLIAGRWCILCWVCGWSLTVLVSSSSPTSSSSCGGVRSGVWWCFRRHVARSDSFNDNGFVSGKLLYRFVNLQISDGAMSSSGEAVIYLARIWWLLRWCRRRGTDVGLSHRFILSFHIFSVL